MFMKRTPNETGEQVSTGMRLFAIEHGRMPTLYELQDLVAEQRGRGISNGSLYNLFKRHGRNGKAGGIDDYARAIGIEPAVIVDGVVFAETHGKLEDPTINRVIPPAPAEVQTPALRIEDMSTADLIGVLGNIATVLDTRKGQIAIFDALARQVLGSTTTVEQIQ
jgi:hypothetical protein